MGRTSLSTVAVAGVLLFFSALPICANIISENSALGAGPRDGNTGTFHTGVYNEPVSRDDLMLAESRQATVEDPNAELRIAVRSEVYIYLNFVLKRIITYRDNLVTIKLYLKPGDVLAFSLYKHDTPVGAVLIDIFYQGHHYYSGESKDFKAFPWTSSRYPQSAAEFRKKNFKDCSWEAPSPVDVAGLPPQSLDFPASASYVWAKYHGVSAANVALRFVVGGDHCPPKRTYCRCREEPNLSGSRCYYFEDPHKYNGYCKSRTCDSKYECVPGGPKSLQLCMARTAEYLVNKTKLHHGRPFCEKVKLQPPVTFWTLYA